MIELIKSLASGTVEALGGLFRILIRPFVWAADAVAGLFWPKKLTLALVLIGKNAKQIPRIPQNSDLPDILDQSKYFLCMSQPEFRTKVNKLNLAEKKENYEDPQLVLVRIDFNHTRSLPERIIKDELKDFLKKAKITNIEENILTKKDGINQAGFIT